METRVEIPDDVVSTVVVELTTSIANIDERNYKRNSPTIHQIPNSERNGNESAYEPKLVSIGPYHQNVHQGSYLDEQTKGMKILYLKNFLQRTGKDVKHYASLIKSEEEKARDCYHNRCNGRGSKEFVQMMVLDGCFIIELLLKVKDNTIDPSFMNKNGRNLRNDLTLMENQIPFFILRLIFDNSDVLRPEVQGDSRSPEILDLCLFFIHGEKITKEMLEQTHGEESIKNVYHLLHLSYLCHMIEIIPEMESPPETLPGHLFGKTKRVFYFIAYVFLFLVKCFLILFFFALILLFEFIKIANKIMWKKPNMYNRQRVRAEEEKAKTIPTATELNEYGVRFKRKKDAKNSIDVSFQDGIMEIPVVYIDGSSNSKFRNYLALERKCPAVGIKFTSYAVFMDYLVDTESDVALLKKRKIIVSMLGSDKEVAKLFNGIAVALVFNPDSLDLSQLFEDVLSYSIRNRKTWRGKWNKWIRNAKRWRAKLTRHYFGSPWSIISLLGALTLLAFAATQVAYAVKKSHRT